MFFQKNLPKWERALRVCSGLLLAITPFFLPLEAILQWVMVAASVTFAATGLIGYCPMCAVFGRRLKKHE